MPCLKLSLEQEGNLGLDAARARNRRSLSAARCAGCGGIGKDAGISEVSEAPALHREAERDTTGSFSRQPLVHTLIGRGAQAKRRGNTSPYLGTRLKSQLTLWIYCGKRAAWKARIRWQAAQIIVFCWEACCCALQHCYVSAPALPALPVRPRGHLRVRPLPRTFRSPRTPAWPVTASARGSFSTSTSPSSFAPLHLPIRIGWWWIFLRSAFNFLPKPASPGAVWSRHSATAWSCRAARESCSI